MCVRERERRRMVAQSRCWHLNVPARAISREHTRALWSIGAVLLSLLPSYSLLFPILPSSPLSIPLSPSKPSSPLPLSPLPSRAPTTPYTLPKEREKERRREESIRLPNVYEYKK